MSALPTVATEQGQGCLQSIDRQTSLVLSQQVLEAYHNADMLCPLPKRHGLHNYPQGSFLFRMMQLPVPPKTTSQLHF